LVPVRSSLGRIFRVARGFDLPNIPAEFLDSVVYLYKDEEGARRGEAAGGTGFFIAFPSEIPLRVFLYAVTNSHVIREGGAPVIRMSMGDDVDILPLTEDDWIHHPDGDDVAISYLGFNDVRDYPAIGKFALASRELLNENNIGPGDETFFVGRFVTHEGRQRNLPTVRFGNIAMMPWEPIRNPRRGINQESFLVEARSLSGYSGSPVFVYQAGYIDAGHLVQTWISARCFLLGIDWCHLATFKSVLDSDKETAIAQDWYVEQNSGMMGVVPAWKIRELLELEEVAQMRKDEEQAAQAENKAKGEGVVLDSADENAERFKSLAKRLVRVPKEEVDEQEAKREKRSR
jgi:hypothetical protein